MSYLPRKIVTLFLAIASASPAVASCRVESDSVKYCEKSLFVILSNPAEVEDQFIGLTGYLRHEQDGYALYFDKARSDLAIEVESIALVAADSEAMLLDRFNEHMIRVNGKFSMSHLPKNYPRAGRLEITLPVFPAPIRASEADQIEFRRKSEASGATQTPRNP